MGTSLHEQEIPHENNVSSRLPQPSKVIKFHGMELAVLKIIDF